MTTRLLGLSGRDGVVAALPLTITLSSWLSVCSSGGVNAVHIVQQVASRPSPLLPPSACCSHAPLLPPRLQTSL